MHLLVGHIPNNEKFIKIKTRAFKLLDENKIATVADYIENKAMFDSDEFKWEYIDKISQKFKRNLRPIILSLNFSSLSKSSYLVDAVILLKKIISNNNAFFELIDDFIPKKLLKYLVLLQR
jgi:hypothetical protein